MEQRYEHTVVEFDKYDYRNTLTRLEEEGWEVCGTLSDTMGQYNGTTHIIFKRPIKKEDEN